MSASDAPLGVWTVDMLRAAYEGAKKCALSMGYDTDDNSDAACQVRMAFVRGVKWATKQSGACSANVGTEQR